MYCFIHGLPTANPGSWNPETGEVYCRGKNCNSLAKEWAELYLCTEKITCPARVEMECVECRQERKRRCSILSTDAGNQASFQRAPFTEAPFVHPFRYPSGHAPQLPAIEFAKSRKERVLWFAAYVKPNVKDKLQVHGERGEQRKEEWLMLPNARTSGVPGLMPLVQELPVRYTDTPDKAAREKGVFKNARGWLRGWELDEAEQQRLRENVDDKEVVLKERPRKLFIEPESAHKDLPLVNGKRIYTLTMKPNEWSLDGQGKSR